MPVSPEFSCGYTIVIDDAQKFSASPKANIMTYSSAKPSIYKNLELESKVAQASAHELITMLFDGLAMQIKRAKALHENGEIQQQNIAIQKATDILDGLHSSISTEVESDLPYNLARLYEYMQRQLLRARISDTVAILDEVLTLTETISSGWQEISDKV